jgi:hypothetical protein
VSSQASKNAIALATDWAVIGLATNSRPARLAAGAFLNVGGARNTASGGYTDPPGGFKSADSWHVTSMLTIREIFISQFDGVITIAASMIRQCGRVSVTMVRIACVTCGCHRQSGAVGFWSSMGKL